MTAIHSNSRFFSFQTNELREFQIEVITFDGESIIVYVEAYTPDEAQRIAATMVENADYTMVQNIA